MRIIAIAIAKRVFRPFGATDAGKFPAIAVCAESGLGNGQPGAGLASVATSALSDLVPKLKFGNEVKKVLDAGNRRPARVQIGIAGVLVVSLLSTAVVRRAVAGTPDNFTGTNLKGSSSYSGGTPGNTSDVLLTSTTTSPAFAAGAVTMESLSATNTLNYFISDTSNATSSANATLTLGNSAGVANANNNNANDLIYIGGTATLLLYGPNNGSAGTSPGTLSLALASNGNFDVTSTNATYYGLQISSVISGAFGFTKTGSGSLLLQGANTFTGTFAANAGTTGLYANSTLGGTSAVSISGTAYVFTYSGLTNAINDAAAVTINGTTAELDLSGGTETVSSLAGTSTTATLNIGDFTDTSTSPSTVYSGSFTVGDGTSTTYAGIISGTRAAAGAIFTKQGSGTLTLTGSNTYIGVTSITGGILATTLLANGGSASGIGASSNAAANLLLGNGTTFQYTGAAVSSDRLFTINGTAAGNSASLDASGTGALSLTNTGSIAYGTINQTRGLILTGTNTGANTLAATIADNGSGATTVTKSGSGTWVLSGTNTYTGGTNINGGILSLGSGIQALGGSGTVSSVGTIKFGGGTLQYSASNTTDYSSRFSGGANQLFSLDTNGQNVTFATSLTSSSGGSLAKLGNGTLTLTGTAATYANGTSITAGTLLVNNASGTATGAGTVSVSSGTTLGGSGFVTGNVTVASGGNLAPGASGGASIAKFTLGTATTGTTTINGTYAVNLTGAATPNAGTTYDQISVLGALTLSTTTSNLTVTTASINGLAVGQTLYIALNDGTDAVTGTFSQGNVVTDNLGDTFAISYAANGDGGGVGTVGNDISLSVLTVVPEPATILGGVFVVGMMGWTQRRRVRGLFTGRRSRAMA